MGSRTDAARMLAAPAPALGSFPFTVTSHVTAAAATPAAPMTAATAGRQPAGRRGPRKL